MAKDKKVVVITGTSSGIGLEASFVFADNGYHVYATSRGVQGKKGDALRKRIKDEGYKNITLLELDVTKQETIDAAFKTIYDTHDKVDILINNAGYGVTKPIEIVTAEQATRQFDVNVVGVVRTMKAVIPQMRKSRSGRIVNVTSIAGFSSFPLWPLYCASKFALEALTRSEAAVLKNFGIQAFTFYPGPVLTPIIDKAEAEQKEVGINEQPKDYDPLFKAFNTSLEGLFKNAQTALECATSLYRASVQKEVKGTYYPNGDLAATVVQKGVVPHDPIGEHALNTSFSQLQLKEDVKASQKEKVSNEQVHA